MLTVPEPRRGFAGRVMARIPTAHPQRTNWRDQWAAFLNPAPAALAVASLAIGVFLAGQITADSPEPGPTDLQATLFAEFFDAAPMLAFDQTSSPMLNETEY